MCEVDFAKMFLLLEVILFNCYATPFNLFNACKCNSVPIVMVKIFCEFAATNSSLNIVSQIIKMRV